MGMGLALGMRTGPRNGGGGMEHEDRNGDRAWE